MEILEFSTRQGKNAFDVIPILKKHQELFTPVRKCIRKRITKISSVQRFAEFSLERKLLIQHLRRVLKLFEHEED